MTITNDMIKSLREKTGAGMMDCKRALEATGGDMEAAIEHLRKRGAATGAKRADRAAREGVIVTKLSNEGRAGVMVEVNCETDFVGRSEDFLGFANAVADAIQQHRPGSVENIAELVAPSGKTIATLMNDLLAKVAEKVEIRRFKIFESSEGTVSCYTHLGNKIGVLVELTGLGSDAGSIQVGRDVAMQIAAMNPAVVSREQLEKATIERELDIYRTQAANEGKPAQIVDKIANGRLEKYYQEVCLVEQIFIKDSGKTIKEYLQDSSANTGTPVTVRRFQRFHLGEETK